MTVSINTPTAGTGSQTADVSTSNSSNVVLAANAVFTGQAEYVAGYAEARVAVFSNVASALNGLQLQQSNDGVNWDNVDSYTIPAGTGKAFGAGIGSSYFRVVYTNGGTIQTSFRLQVVYHYSATKPSSVRPQDARTNDNDFTENMSYNAVLNGVSWDRVRTPLVFKPLTAVSIATEATIWSPAAGTKFRIMGFLLTSGVVGGNVILKDNTAGTTILVIPFGAAAVPIFSSDMGNGILSATANNVLTATGTATQTLSGYVFGTEE